jgi:hypothetical protein
MDAIIPAGIQRNCFQAILQGLRFPWIPPGNAALAEGANLGAVASVRPAKKPKNEAGMLMKTRKSLEKAGVSLINPEKRLSAA